MAMGMAGEGLAATLRANENSRHGWVPHTLIFNWLQEVWEDAWTPDIFWNMILHTRNENKQHCYM
eukprot:11731959-Heterocapsa_arctica.AAC.1